ncbi:hypothetical protein B0H67DRAFT_482825, partial [Lasiosphaeris hirsuta]
GMFLYASVVLGNLQEQGSEADLEDELCEHFPNGLEQAYHRVAVRILERAPPRRCDAAMKILRWISCAARPLHWREIQTLFCISPENAICDGKKRRAEHCKDICGSLVEVQPCNLEPSDVSESTLRLVHTTAKR